MARTKITAYVTPEIAETLKRLAAIDDRSLSDIVEDAIIRRLSTSGAGAEHAVLLARLDQFGRQLRRIEHAQDTHFELTAHVGRFALSVAPDIPEGDVPAIDARGSDRLRNILGIVVSRLSAGRSVCRDTLAQLSAGPIASATGREAAE